MKLDAAICAGLKLLYQFFDINLSRVIFTKRNKAINHLIFFRISCFGEGARLGSEKSRKIQLWYNQMPLKYGAINDDMGKFSDRPREFGRIRGAVALRF
ncbi:hypothetical protein [Algirhabdus cladophorae]|uniref:hypothetical protein n=1 Tax=Algirhabdus cladophorae TaxID=3377108 RepID=UPI003B849687